MSEAQAIAGDASNAGVDAASSPLAAARGQARGDRRRAFTAPRLTDHSATAEAHTLLADSAAPPSPRDSLRRRSLALADVLALAAAYGVVSLLVSAPAGQTGRLALLAALPFWVVLNKALRLYDRDANLIHKSTINEMPAVLNSVSVGSALLTLLGPTLLGLEIGRTQTVTFWAAALVLMPALRWIARTAVRQYFPAERCLIVGSGSVARLVARKIAAHPEYGADLVGFLDEPGYEPGYDLAGAGELKLLGSVEEFERVCDEYDVERVVVAFSTLSHEHLLDVIRVSKGLPLRITIVPRLFEVMGHAVEIDQVEGMTLLGLRGVARTRSSLLLKRSIDLAVATVGLMLLSPVLLVLAVAIKLTSPGPIFYAQDRIGRGNRPFRMYKFRTMVEGADTLKSDLVHLNEATGPMFKIADDPRITRVGRVLRKASLDELPQLWNVVRGEMSLVGPRPLIPSEHDHVIGWHRARIELTPGLTGPWQVMGRTAIPFEEMVKLDYIYVAEWSLWNDIKLLVRTLPVVLQGRGA